MDMQEVKLCREVYTGILGENHAEVIEQLTEKSRVIYVSKKQILIREGKTQDKLYFIYSGVFRGYTTNKNGRELTESLKYKRGTPILVGTTLETDKPSEFSFQAIESGIIVEIAIEEILQMRTKYACLKDVHICYLEESLAKHMDMQRMRSMDGRMRCLWFKEQYPELVERMQKQYIASLLDMTLSTYGKIMRKISQENRDLSAVKGHIIN